MVLDYDNEMYSYNNGNFVIVEYITNVTYNSDNDSLYECEKIKQIRILSTVIKDDKIWAKIAIVYYGNRNGTETRKYNSSVRIEKKYTEDKSIINEINNIASAYLMSFINIDKEKLINDIKNCTNVFDCNDIEYKYGKN